MDEFLSDKQKKISVEILKEIRTRLKFLLDVGLDYLALNRSSVSLSGDNNAKSDKGCVGYVVGSYLPILLVSREIGLL